MVVVIGFHCDVNSCEACSVAQPRSAAAAESSAFGRGNAVGLISVLDWGSFFTESYPAALSNWRVSSLKPSVLTRRPEFIDQCRYPNNASATPILPVAVLGMG